MKFHNSLVVKPATGLEHSLMQYEEPVPFLASEEGREGKYTLVITGNHRDSIFFRQIRIYALVHENHILCFYESFSKKTI